MRQHHFNGASSKPRKQLENAATPTRRVHAVLGCFLAFTYLALANETHPLLYYLY
jgi:hypothetical protein